MKDFLKKWGKWIAVALLVVGIIIIAFAFRSVITGWLSLIPVVGAWITKSKKNREITATIDSLHAENEKIITKNTEIETDTATQEAKVKELKTKREAMGTMSTAEALRYARGE